MPRKMTYPERAQANVPEGTLARLQAAALPDEEVAGVIRRALLEWLELTAVPASEPTH